MLSEGTEELIETGKFLEKSVIEKQSRLLFIFIKESLHFFTVKLFNAKYSFPSDSIPARASSCTHETILWIPIFTEGVDFISFARNQAPSQGLQSSSTKLHHTTLAPLQGRLHCKTDPSSVAQLRRSCSSAKTPPSLRSSIAFQIVGVCSLTY